MPIDVETRSCDRRCWLQSARISPMSCCGRLPCPRLPTTSCPSPSRRERPDYLDPEVELVVGRYAGSGGLRAALGASRACSIAAMVGWDQSMYALAP